MANGQEALDITLKSIENLYQRRLSKVKVVSLENQNVAQQDVVLEHRSRKWKVRRIFFKKTEESNDFQWTWIIFKQPAKQEVDFWLRKTCSPGVRAGIMVKRDRGAPKLLTGVL